MNVSNWGSQPRANNTGKQRMKTEGGGGERGCVGRVQKECTSRCRYLQLGMRSGRVCGDEGVGVCVRGCGCVDIRYVQRVFEPSKYKNTIKIHHR